MPEQRNSLQLNRKVVLDRSRNTRVTEKTTSLRIPSEFRLAMIKLIIVDSHGNGFEPDIRFFLTATWTMNARNTSSKKNTASHCLEAANLPQTERYRDSVRFLTLFLDKRLANSNE